MDQGLAQQLRNGLDALSIEADEQSVEALMRYLSELETWNRAYNLTAVRHPQAMVVRHLLDSAAVLPLLMGATVLDVGSGAGLPGLVLAILSSQRRYTLLDSNGKKARFMRHAVRTLGLSGVEIAECRLDEHQSGPYDTVTARAFAEPALLLAGVRRLTAPGGVVLALQGRRPETFPSCDGFDFQRCVELEVPGLDAQRHVLIYHRWPESSP